MGVKGRKKMNGRSRRGMADLAADGDTEVVKAADRAAQKFRRSRSWAVQAIIRVALIENPSMGEGILSRANEPEKEVADSPTASRAHA